MLYQIYNHSLSARVCISDTTRTRKLYNILYIYTCIYTCTVLHLLTLICILSLGGVSEEPPEGPPPHNPYFSPSRLSNFDPFHSPSSDKGYGHPDGFDGARRDLRLFGLQRPHTLDGSSTSSFDGEYYYGTTRVTQGPFNQENLVRDFCDPRGNYHGQYRGAQGLAAAGGHTLTGTVIKLCCAVVCSLLHCTALHCTALHCTALHCTALHCTVLCCGVLYYATLHSVTMFHVISYCTVLSLT